MNVWKSMSQPRHKFLGLQVVIGCVLAAGCTSSQQTLSTDDKILGAWTHPTDQDDVVVVMMTGGKGYIIGLAKEPGTRLLRYSPLTWTKNSNGTITHVIEGISEPVILTYDAAKDQFTDNLGYTSTRMDPVTGIWFSEGKDSVIGKNAKKSYTVKNDGTGILDLSYDDNTTKSVLFNWEKNADGSYTIAFAGNGNTVTWTLDKTKNTVTTSSGKQHTRKFADSYYYLSVLGPWYDEENNYLTFFNADGTGTTYKGKEQAKDNVIFTWTIPEFGKFKLHIQSGTTPEGLDITGQDRIWIYDRVNDTFTAQNGSVCVRPIDAVGDFTLENISSIVGEWGRKSQKDGEIKNAVLYLRPDHGGYWMALNNDAIGIVISEAEKQTWEKTGNNTYRISSTDGNVYNAVYNPEKDVLIQSGKDTFIRLDPFIGFWTGPTSSNDGGKTTTVYKEDGTGLSTISYDKKGTAEISTLTWKKNTDGTYVVDYSNGKKRTYTISPSGLLLKSSGGSVKSKDFLDESFLMSIAGPWYCEDKGFIAVFNGDYTGFINGDKSISQFTWKVNNIGKFEITYTSGVGSDGKSLVGQKREWTYDRDNDVFLSYQGNKYIRPTENIKNLITFT